jgi:LCP family protein required for cell wall assembly
MKRLLRFLPLIIWMIVIFVLSAEGKDVSSGRSDVVVDVVKTFAGTLSTEVLTFFTRKSAHIVAYAVLGVLALITIRPYVKPLKKAALLSIGFVAAYAITDELHQLFVPGRSGEVRDVLLDTLAASVSVGSTYVYIMCEKIKARINKKRTKKQQKLYEQRIRLTAKIIAVVLIASFLLMAYVLFATQVVPGKYLGIFFLISSLTTAAVAYILFNKSLSIKRTVMLWILAAVMVLGNSGLFMIGITANAFLQSLQQTTQQTQEYSIVALKSKAIQLDNPDQTYSVLQADPNVEKVQSGAATKTAATAKLLNTPTEMILALQQGDTQLSVFQSSYVQLLRDANPDVSVQLEVLATFTIQVSPGINESEADVSKPFALYISGIDTYGEIADVSRSDVNIIAIVNPTKHSVLLVNTPRDYYVQLHGTIGTKDKLTHAGIYGVETSAATLGDLYDIPIDYTLRINFSSLVKVVDTLGGISVYSDYDFTADGNRFTVGTNQLNGAQALAFSRERYSFEGGDRTRGENQLRVIRAIIAKISTPSTAVRYQQVLGALQGAFQTNMSTDQMTTLFRNQLNDAAQWSTTSVSVDGTGATNTTYSTGAAQLYVMIPDQATVDAAKRKIQQNLIP